MKKFISTIMGALMMFALSAPLATIAKSAEFFTIGTGGPTGVYFQTGNAICKMMHKFAISADHGKKNIIELGSGNGACKDILKNKNQGCRK